MMVGAYKNAKDVEEAAYRTRGGQVRVVESGRSSGRIPYGYRKIHRADDKNGCREVDETKRPIARRLFEDTAAGLSPNQICANLNREGDPGPRGNGWRPGALVGGKKLGGGILRNRIYIGEINWGRTERKRRKGKIVFKPAPASKQVRSIDPSLAIIEPELFDRVQLILSGKKGQFYNNKKAEYLYSGKFWCGLCGETMILISGKLACTGRHAKGTLCKNSARVPRQDAERAVLNGLSTHLLQREFIEPSVAAYRVEAERAASAFAGKMEADKAKLVEAELRIAGLWPLINDIATPVFAKQALMGQLNTFEAERQRLELEVKQRPPQQKAGLDTERIIDRLKAAVEDLSGTLEGQERDAVIARDVLRSMVDAITITPDLATMDRRGSGKVYLKVEGSLTRLLDLGDVPVERDMKRSSGPQTVLDVAKVAYTFTTSVTYTSERLSDVFQVLPVVSKLLDEAQKPVGKAEFMAALGATDGTGPDERTRLEQRLRSALDYLLKRGLAHNIPARHNSGWVWSDSSLGDAEWKARAMYRPSAPPLTRILKAWAPEASVVVISSPAPAVTPKPEDE